MRREELCSDCYVGRLQMMQASPYSIYGTYYFYKDALEYAKDKCPIDGQDTEPQPPLIPARPDPETWCLSNVNYTTSEGDTCDSIAQKHSVSSASVFMSSSHIQNCSSISAGVSICLPLECKTYVRKEDQDCLGVQLSTNVRISKIQQYNPWISSDCKNIKSASLTYGNVLCLSATGGEYTGTTNNTRPDRTNEQYTHEVKAPPEGSEVAQGTTLECGRWHVAKKGENCAGITQNFISASLFRWVNPSLRGGDCSGKLVAGRSYCTGPVA